MRFLGGIFGVCLSFATLRARADTAVLLSSATETAAARIDMIRSARSEIILGSYIFRADQVSMKLLAELRQAARPPRNVEVKIIVDAFGESIPASVMSYLQSEGIKFYQYHPTSYPLIERIFNRLHCKFLIVDRKKLLTGDRNIGNEYFGIRWRKFFAGLLPRFSFQAESISREVYSEGKGAAQAHDQFQKLVAYDGTLEHVPFFGVSLLHGWAKKRLDQAARRSYHFFLSKGAQWADELKSVDEVEYFYDEPGQKNTLPGTVEKVLEGIHRAQKSIVIENPYIVLSDRMWEALREAAHRGVKITVITNSFNANDVPLVWKAWTESRERLAALGADIYEHPGAKGVKHKIRRILKRYSGYGFIHSKAMVIDKMESFVMSFNMDDLSEVENLESGLRVRDKKFAENLQKEILGNITEKHYLHVAHGGKETAQAKHCPQWFRDYFVMPFKGRL